MTLIVMHNPHAPDSLPVVALEKAFAHVFLARKEKKSSQKD